MNLAAPYWPPIDKQKAKAHVQGDPLLKQPYKPSLPGHPWDPETRCNGDLQDTTSGQQQVSGELFPPRLGLPHEEGPQTSRTLALDPGVPRIL